jgi:hypothetical protein
MKYEFLDTVVVGGFAVLHLMAAIAVCAAIGLFA